MIEDVVILAAGSGSRLQALGASKPLVRLAGRTLIDRAIASAFAAGVSRAVVITGHQSAAVEMHLDELRARSGWSITTRHNPDFTAQNGLSVLCARPLLDGRPFFLAMCDHLVEPAIYHRLMDASLSPGSVALGIDRRLDNPLVELDDVTRVDLDGARIRDIGKGLKQFNAFDTGIFAAGPALYDAIEKSGRDQEDFSISGGMRELARSGRAIGVDIGDACWIDIDNPRMHGLAEEWIRASESLVS